MPGEYSHYETIRWGQKPFIVVYIDPENSSAGRDGSSPDKALIAFPYDLRCPLIGDESSSYENISEDMMIDTKVYGICYIVKRTDRNTHPARLYQLIDNTATPTVYYKDDTYPLNNIMIMGCPCPTDELYSIMPETIKENADWCLRGWDSGSNTFTDTTYEYANIQANHGTDTNYNVNHYYPVVGIFDTRFKTFVMNRCFVYRRAINNCLSPIFEFHNRTSNDYHNYNTRVAVNIQNCKFGYQASDDTFWDFDDPNWSTAISDTEDKYATAYMYCSDVDQLVLKNVIINYGAHGNETSGYGRDNARGKYARMMSPDNDTYNTRRNLWSSFTVSYGRHHGLIFPYIVHGQAHNITVNQMTTKSTTSYNTSTNTGYSGREDSKSNNALVLNSAINSSSYDTYDSQRTNFEIVNFNVKYIFNKYDNDVQSITPTLECTSFDYIRFRNFTASFQKSEEGEIIAAGGGNPSRLMLGPYYHAFYISAYHYNIDNVNIDLRPCWYMCGYYCNIVYIRTITSYANWNEPGKESYINDITVRLAEDSSEAHGSNRGFVTPFNYNSDGWEQLNEGNGGYALVIYNWTTQDNSDSWESYYRYNRYFGPADSVRPVIKNIRIYNKFGHAAYFRGCQLQPGSIFLNGCASFSDSFGTVEYVNYGYSGNAISCTRGSCIRVKRCLVDISASSDLTNVVMNWNANATSSAANSMTYGYSSSYNSGTNFNGPNKGAFLLIDKCNKQIITVDDCMSRGYQHNEYGIVCLNEKLQDLTIDTDPTEEGNGRFAQYSGNYRIIPYTIRRANGGEASLYVENQGGGNEVVIGRRPFDGIYVDSSKAFRETEEGVYEEVPTEAGKQYKLVVHVGMKNFTNFSRKQNTEDSLPFMPNFMRWEAVCKTKVHIDDGSDSGTDVMYEKVYMNDSSGWWEEDYDTPWTYESGTEITASQDVFTEDSDFKYKSTMIITLEDTEEPINLRFYLNTANSVGGRFFFDPKIDVFEI